VVLSPGEEFLGAIWSNRLESILTNRGAYLRAASGWKFVAYSEINEVTFPEKTDPRGSLTLHTSDGSFQLLKGNKELWEVGRFFMRCAGDARNS